MLPCSASKAREQQQQQTNKQKRAMRKMNMLKAKSYFRSIIEHTYI
jgi:hypothetical protein